MTRKLKITKRQAIKECKELWELIAKDKLLCSKYEVIKKYNLKIAAYRNECPLCEYVAQFETEGDHAGYLNKFPGNLCLMFCPLCKKFEDRGCLELGYPYSYPKFVSYIRKL